MSDFLMKSASCCSISSDPCLLLDGEVGKILGARGVLEASQKCICRYCIRPFMMGMRSAHINDRLDRRHVIPYRQQDDPRLDHKVLVLDADLIEKNRGNGFHLSIRQQLVVAIGGPGCYRSGGYDAIDCIPVEEDPQFLLDENKWFTAYRSEVLGVANLEAIMYYLKSYVYHNVNGAFVTELTRLQGNIIKLGGDVSCLPFSKLVPRRIEFQDSFLVT